MAQLPVLQLPVLQLLLQLEEGGAVGGRGGGWL